MDKNFAELKKWILETKEEPLETMAGFFDARIGDYEAHMARWSGHYRWMAEHLPPRMTDLLDIGCGSGLELDCIFERFPDLRATGVDLSGEMLAKLGRKHPDKALTLIRADYFSFDMGKGRYDAVVSFETLHHFKVEKKTELFGKIYESLRPGGVYLECDYIALSQEIEDTAFAECERRRRRDGIPDGVFVHFDTPLTLEHEISALKRGGFDRVEVVGFLPNDDHTPLIRAVKP